MSAHSLEKGHDGRVADVAAAANACHTGDEEFGGTDARKKLEKKLLRKLDARMSILIVVYILNYVSFQPSSACTAWWRLLYDRWGLALGLIEALVPL